MKDIRKILVTGTQRSGTTWVGRVLSSDGNIGYIHEPFNRINKKIHNSPIIYPYQYIDKRIDVESEHAYSKYLEYFIRQDISFYRNSILGLKHIDSRFVNPMKHYFDNKKSQKLKIIKDPFALLSCEWLQLQQDFQIVIVIRHPAAFALSMKEKGWIVTPSTFKTQENDLAHFYNSDQSIIQSYLDLDNKKKNYIDSAIYGWNLLYSAIIYYKQNYPDWIMVRHEDLSNSPINEFRKLFGQLSLDFDKVALKQIKDSSQGSGVKGAYRDSKLNAQKWKQILSKEEILRIKSDTELYWKHFYSESDW